MRTNRTTKRAAMASIIFGVLGLSLVSGGTPASAASCPVGTYASQFGPDVGSDGVYTVPTAYGPILGVFFNNSDPLYGDGQTDLQGTRYTPDAWTGELVLVTLCKLDPTSTTVPATTVPATTVPATTVPATTVPATTVPATTVPATTVPATTVPATTVPATTVPATTVPATTVPATTIPATTAPATTVTPVESTTTAPTAVLPEEGTTPATTLPTPVGNLPATGVSNGIIAGLALAFFAVGAVLTFLTRRPETALDDRS